jgi:hypothetical protein
MSQQPRPIKRWRFTLARKDTTLNAAQAQRRMVLEVDGRGKEDATKNARAEMKRTGQDRYFTIQEGRAA